MVLWFHNLDQYIPNLKQYYPPIIHLATLVGTNASLIPPGGSYGKSALTYLPGKGETNKIYYAPRWKNYPSSVKFRGGGCERWLQQWWIWVLGLQFWLPYLDIYNLRSAKNAPGFASAWDLRNMDLPHFRIFLAALTTRTLNKIRMDHDED